MVEWRDGVAEALVLADKWGKRRGDSPAVDFGAVYRDVCACPSP
jgi:hypothetical protein